MWMELTAYIRGEGDGGSSNPCRAWPVVGCNDESVAGTNGKGERDMVISAVDMAPWSGDMARGYAA